jgi:hypothetical protein
MKISIGSQASGKFGFLALYPYDSQVIFRFPSRGVARRQGKGPVDRLEELRDLLNGAQIPVEPQGPQQGAKLEFLVEPLSEIFVDSPNATWSTLRATLPSHLFRSFFAKLDLPEEVYLVGVKAELFLFDGGIVILALESIYGVSDSTTWVDRFPRVVQKTAEQTVRYKNEDLTSFCKHLLTVLGARLRTVVLPDIGAHGGGISPLYSRYVSRIRHISVPESYPTIVTKIFCKGSTKPRAFDLRGSDLPDAMYLDASELVNALPSFEDDFIAVGYDSVWWLLAEFPEERTDRFRDRVEVTFKYSLAVSMLIYVLHTEVDQELTTLRHPQIPRLESVTELQRELPDVPSTCVRFRFWERLGVIPLDFLWAYPELIPGESPLPMYLAYCGFGVHRQLTPLALRMATTAIFQATYAYLPGSPSVLQEVLTNVERLSQAPAVPLRRIPQAC